MIDLCWIRLTGRERATGENVTTFHVLMRAETPLAEMVRRTDSGYTMELREPVHSYSQPIPLVGPGIRIVNL